MLKLDCHYTMRLKHYSDTFNILSPSLSPPAHLLPVMMDQVVRPLISSAFKLSYIRRYVHHQHNHRGH